MDSTLSGVCAATSTPAEKFFPAPEITIVEIFERVSMPESACANSSIMGISITLRGGLLRTSRAVGLDSAKEIRAN